MGILSGTVTDGDDNAVEGALVTAVSAERERTFGSDTTDANGEYAIGVPSGENVHAVVQHDDGTQQYNALSKPYVDAPVEQLYVSSADTSSSGADVYALDRDDGSTIWTRGSTGPMRGTPAVKDGTVYAYGFNMGGIVALDPVDGSTLWSRGYSSIYFQDMVVQNGILFINADLGNGYRLIAMDADTGNVMRYRGNNGIYSSPAVEDGLAAHSGEDQFEVLDVTDGFKTDWYRQDISGAHTSPTFVDGIIYYANPDSVYAINADDAKIIWQRDIVGSEHATPAVVDGTVYVGTKGGTHGLVALDAATGQFLWGREFGDFSTGLPAVVDDTVYVATYSDGTLYALDVSGSSSSLLWSHTTSLSGHSHMSHPTVVGDEVFYTIGQDDGTSGAVYSVDRSDGSRNWERRMGVDDGAVAVDGTVEWQFSQRNEMASTNVPSTTYGISASVTSDEADADETQENEWTVDVTGGSSAVLGGEVLVASGYDEGSLGGVSAGDRAQTNEAGTGATFTATASSAGDYTLGFDYTMADSTATATSTFLQGIEPIELFNDDLSAWSGGGSNTNIVSSPTHEGSGALELVAGYNGLESHPGDGLENYPVAGDTWDTWVRWTDSAPGRMYYRFFYNGGSDWYGLLIEGGDGAQLRTNGGSTTLAEVSMSDTSAGNWYRFNIDWAENGDYTITLYDGSGAALDSITGNSTDYTNGGVMFLDIDTVGTYYFDHMHIV